MATTGDTVRPKKCASEGKCKKSIRKLNRSYLLVLCLTIIINKGFLFADALQHRHRGEYRLRNQLSASCGPRE